MQLDEQWNWKSRKLACRVMQESGNPAGDELRERFAELVGLDLNNILNDMKNNRKRKETLNKSAALLETEEDRTFKSLLNRSHILGAAKISLDELKKKDDMFTNSKANDNLKKMYARLPKSPPRRVLLEIQRERAKPLQLPDQDEEAEAKAKKEKKLAKQRSSRLLPLEEKDLKRSIDESNSPRRPLTEILKHYEGDMFGSGGPYLESMLYLSRMSDSENKSHRFTHDSHVEDADKESKILPLNTTIEGKIDESSLQSDDYRNNNNNDDVSYTDNNSKLYCAASLCNWSRDPVNANRLASEGAIRAISQLFLENNSKIQRFCACAYRFMSEHLPLANAMIDEGVTNTMSDFIGQSSDDFICSNLAISIVNLTRIGGKEGQLVDAAVVLALQNLILIQPELSGTCARGLYNLTCVDTSYPFIERVIKALVTLSSSGVSNVKHICAAALCNLSDLRSVRPRLIEEGTVNVLSQLSRGAETRTRRICAVILQNLSASKICRIEMATKSGVTVAYSLSADQDPIILRAIGLTISRLSSEASNCNRIIYENGITALCNIAVKYPTIPGITQPIAVAFQLLAGRSQVRQNIIQEGSITAIASLLRLSNDLLTLQNSLLSLCYLLTENDSHLPIVQQGLIITLMNLMNHNDYIIRDLCALAFYNLSCFEESRKHIVNSGAIATITNLNKKISNISDNESTNDDLSNNISLSPTRNQSEISNSLSTILLTKRRCAATLCYVSTYEIGLTRMVNDGIIQCLLSLLLTNDISIVHFSCVSLCYLCCNEENCSIIIKSSNTILKLISDVLDKSCDDMTKQYICALLSCLSYYDISKYLLVEYGILKILSILSNMSNNITKQRCLVIYANLSCNIDVHNHMIEHNVVKIISELSESYQEINYICCTKAFCNLSYNQSLHSSIAQDGGIYALLMISMVHSVDKHTKYLCLIAFLNLLDDVTIIQLVQDGLLSVINSLSKILDHKIIYLCGVLVNQVSRYDIGSQAMIDKHANISALYHIYENSIVILDKLTDEHVLNRSDSLSSDKSNQLINPITNQRTNNHLVNHTAIDLSADSLDESTANEIKSKMYQTKILISRTCNNLILKHQIIDNGMINILTNSLLLNNIETTIQSLQSIYNLCTNSDNLVKLASYGAVDKQVDKSSSNDNEKSIYLTGILPMTLVNMLPKVPIDNPYDEFENESNSNNNSNQISNIIYNYIIKILCILTHNKKSRKHLQLNDFISIYIKSITVYIPTDLSTINLIAQSIKYLITNYNDIQTLLEFNVINGLINLIDVTIDNYNNKDKYIFIYISEIIRILCNDGNISGNDSSQYEIINTLASSNVINQLLYRIVEAIPTDSQAMYNIAYILFIFISNITYSSITISSSPVYLSTKKRAITPTVRLSSMASIHSDSRIKSAIPTTKSIIEALGEHEECYELLAAILCVYLYDQKCRYNFSFPSIAEILLRIIQSKPNEQILHNTISALYGMSRMPKCREFLSVPPLNIDATLIALSHTESNNIKRNIARVLKNLSADSNEAIEEGAVAALIAISLEGKQKNKVGNDIYLPDINPIESDKLQTNTLTNNQLDTSTLLWYDTYDPILVEAAGKGPDPPSPPSMLVNSPDIYSSIYEDNDNSANDLLENKTKMAFAKMQIPSELKNSYLISEDEYKVRGSDDISRVDSQEEGESFGDGDSLHRGGDFDTNSESFPSNDNKIDIPINTNHSIHSDNKLSKSKSLSSSEHLKDKDNEKHSKSSGKTKKQSKSISFNTNNNAVISKSSEKAIELGLYS